MTIRRTILIFIGLASSIAACGSPDTPCDTSVVNGICTIAGNGDNAYLGDDGPALSASMSLPQDVLYAPDGEVYILDWNNHRLRKVTTDGRMEHVAGRGELGGTLDDPANNDFNHPPTAVFGPKHETIIIAAWHNSKIRTLDLASGRILDTCGDGRRAYFGDETGALNASLDLPSGLVFDPEGNLVVMDQANQVLRYIDSEGIIHNLAGTCVVEPAEGCDGLELQQCPDFSGKHYCGNVSDCFEPCTPGFFGEDSLATEMRMSQPFGQSADPGGRMLYDPQGNLLFADSNNHIIRKIDPQGIVSTIAGTPPIDGQPQYGYSGDGGPALSAKLDNPVDLALAENGTLYFTDVYNHCVRAISPSGIIDTVAGICGEPGYSGDDGPAKEAQLKRPYGLEIGNGTLYIADTGNNVIRAIKLP